MEAYGGVNPDHSVDEMARGQVIGAFIYCYKMVSVTPFSKLICHRVDQNGTLRPCRGFNHVQPMIFLASSNHFRNITGV